MYARAYSEVYEILNLASDDLKSNIPASFMQMLENERDFNYKPEYNINIPLEEQNLMKKTIDILALLKLKYWCNEEEKKNFTKMLNENERKNNEKLSEVSNYDDLFKGKKVEKASNNVETIETKEQKESKAMIKENNNNFFTRIISKIKAWLKK